MIGLDRDAEPAGRHAVDRRPPVERRRRAERRAADRGALRDLAHRAQHHRLADVLPHLRRDRQRHRALEPQPHDAGALPGRAEEGRQRPVRLQRPRCHAVDLRGRRLLVLDQLLQQMIVEIAEAFEHLRPRLLLSRHHAFRHLDELRPRSLAPGKRPLRDQVGDPGDPLALPHGHLAKYDRRARIGLERRHDVPDPRLGGIHLVDKKKGGKPRPVDQRKIGGRKDRRVRIRRHHHHRGIRGRQRAGRIREVLRPPRDIRRHPVVAEKSEFRQAHHVA